MTLHLDEQALVSCVACGLCLPHCPTYRVSGLEMESPRGRIAGMRAVEAGALPIDDAFVDSMETCVQCRGCEAACPSSVPFGKLMEETRAAIRENPPEPPTVVRRAVEWLGYRLVLPYHAVLMALTWLLLIGQRLHLVPSRFGVPKLRATSLRTPLRADAAPDVILFTGCVMDAWQRDVHRAAADVLRATGARVGVAGRGADCCGALHAHAGRLEEAKRLARRVIASMPGDALIAVDSAGCGAALKEYGRLLGTPEAVAFSSRVRDVTELVVERGVPSLRAVAGTTIVVQDPCHLRHVQKVHGPVRTALRAAYDLAEPDDEGLCCGAGGTYSIAQPELSTAIRDRKVEALQRAAAGRRFVVASANPGCAMHLAAAGLPVKHPVELLAEALE